MQSVSQASIRYLNARTITVVDTFNLSASMRQKWSVFSGTLISLGRRLFVATVSHSLNNFDYPTRYHLVGKNGRPIQRDKLFIRTIANDDDKPDVGLMEVDRAFLADHHDLSVIDESKISAHSPELLLSTLMGTPVSTIQISMAVDSQWGIKGTMMGFLTAPVSVENWPSLLLQNPLDIDLDLLVKYPSNADTIRTDEGKPDLLPNPHGVSGGGLWIHNDCDDGLWTPEKSQLVGIQSSWLKMRGYVRLTRVSQWLNLVAIHYPDLRAILSEVAGYNVPA